LRLHKRLLQANVAWPLSTNQRNPCFKQVRCLFA
jgi:hypothetical protein